ncbi:putative phenylalanyl-tRNA synthetase alpha chain A [Besnoitia besnoiti]|uniref:phenylalanine--tRNA ligase n=1 Tax=Besnoitia besnoiti TaxID=94643 RepID=A0A2A9MJN3_BESBE|nr:putative phenylalanyl-tRNA synthetase alpha chain A [Besnoitia besnoiti]PFH35807.1 putative phenylalanyl-tRNA synthetase alpha chain A [Besnoitia besnoiti]
MADSASAALMDDFLQALDTELGSQPVISTLDITGNPAYATKFGGHDKIVGLVKSLQANEYILGEQAEKSVWNLTGEGQLYAKEGSPEFRLVMWMKDHGNEEGGVDMAVVKAGFGSEADVAVSNAMKMRWLQIDKATKLLSIKQAPQSDNVKVLLDAVQAQQHASAGADQDDEAVLFKRLLDLAAPSTPEKTLQARTHENELKKRKLVELKKVKYIKLQKGPKFSLQMMKPVADLTAELLIGDEWEQANFKEYNFFASGKKIRRGSVHPLMQAMKQFKHILMCMGFEEMPTNQYVESSFWCFDSLFMPQQHPARDAQDTFFLQAPKSSDSDKIPRMYFDSVREVHEHGGHGSIGWQYDWSVDETMSNILRTHTTATSARMLYKLAQEFKKSGVFRPRKFFSIDRVFRNETLDATHLAEFHQVEGLVADRGLTIGHLMGVMETFYKQIGIEQLKFKPAYNPYTEPSMEIFGYHPGLKRWIEVGNSGIFRPEMLLPMGLPEDVTVIAWGLSLERPTMIRYGISNIRQLIGHRAMLGLA